MIVFGDNLFKNASDFSKEKHEYSVLFLLGHLLFLLGIWDVHNWIASASLEICLQMVCFTAAGHALGKWARTLNMVVVVPCHCCRCGFSNCWYKACI